MIFDILLAICLLILYVDAYCAIRKNTKDIDDLSSRYFILKEKTRDFETRIRYLETEEARRKRMQALPEAENKSYII